ncbi:hypothetical protein STEG23_032031 [Scotinomys teguina]
MKAANHPGSSPAPHSPAEEETLEDSAQMFLQAGPGKADLKVTGDKEDESGAVNCAHGAGSRILWPLKEGKHKQWLAIYPKTQPESTELRTKPRALDLLATWLPAYLSMGVYPLCSMSCVPGLNVARLFYLTGSELPYCPGLWSPLDWAPTMDLQDTERHPKRVRTMFNLQQLEELEKVFAKQHNLVGKKRAQLAARLHLTENQVRIWFQNRRVKYQKQQKLKSPSSSAMEEPSSSSDGSIQSEDAERGTGS